MDEPTSALTAHEVEVLFGLIARAQEPRRRARLHHAQVRGAAAHRRRRGRHARRPRGRRRRRWRSSTRDGDRRADGRPRSRARLFPRSPVALARRGAARRADVSLPATAPAGRCSSTTCRSRAPRRSAGHLRADGRGPHGTARNALRPASATGDRRVFVDGQAGARSRRPPTRSPPAWRSRRRTASATGSCCR